MSTIDRYHLQTIALENLSGAAMNMNWTGLRVVCQAGLNDTESLLGVENSDAAVVEVRISKFERLHDFTVEPSGYT